MSFVRMRTLYQCLETNKMSTNYVTLLLKKLTLQSNFVEMHFDRNNQYYQAHPTAGTRPQDLQTLFREVQIIPPEKAVTPEMRKLFNTLIGVNKMTETEFLRGLRTRLMQTIEKYWKSEMAHGFMHSSGLDSRMLSWTLKQIHNRRGDGWLGQVLFICSKFEGSEFKKIMEYEGWDKSQYFVVDEKLNDEEYFASSELDFENAWKEHGGVSDDHSNEFWWAPKRAQERGLLPENIQLWSGMWGGFGVINAASPNGGQSFINIFNEWYTSHIFHRPYRCSEVILPYSDIDYLCYIMKSSIRLGRHLRPKLLRSMDNGLAEFINLQRIEIDKSVAAPIADWILERVISDYRKSWYGREIHPKVKLASNTNHYHPFWAHRSAASLCEYLRKNNYEIKVA